MNKIITHKQFFEEMHKLWDECFSKEPTAWYNADDSSLSFKNHGGGWQPLYTHPHKQLSDEEIEKVRVTIMETAYWCADENMPEAYNAVKVCCSEVLAIIKASRGEE